VYLWVDGIHFGVRLEDAAQCILVVIGATADGEKDREALLRFYDFPAEHWVRLRTTNPIESTFATVRLRTAKTRGCVSRESILAMVFMLVKSAERHWRKLNGIPRLAQLIEGVIFTDGVLREDVEKIAASSALHTQHLTISHDPNPPGRRYRRAGYRLAKAGLRHARQSETVRTRRTESPFTG
jgi:hypothetical protein